MIKWIWSKRGFYYAKHNPTIRADKFGNVFSGGDGKEEQPQVQYSQPPEYAYQMDLFKKFQEPYMEKQFGLYKDVFEPQSRALGGILGKQLEQPLQLPEEVWANVWQKGRERVIGEYAPLKQQATERAAGRGMLGQGTTEKYFQNLDIAQGKSLESMAVDMVIQEWTEKKTAQQQAIQNMQGFITGQPAFNLTMPTSTPYTSAPEQGGNPWGSMLQGGSMGALAGLALAIPTGGLSIPMGLALGGGLGAAGGLGGYYANR